MLSFCWSSNTKAWLVLDRYSSWDMPLPFDLQLHLKLSWSFICWGFLWVHWLRAAVQFRHYVVSTTCSFKCIATQFQMRSTWFISCLQPTAIGLVSLCTIMCNRNLLIHITHCSKHCIALLSIKPSHIARHMHYTCEKRRCHTNWVVLHCLDLKRVLFSKCISFQGGHCL